MGVSMPQEALCAYDMWIIIQYLHDIYAVFQPVGLVGLTIEQG